MLSYEKKIRSELGLLRGAICENPREVTGWRMRRCYYQNPGRYNWLDDDSRTLEEGEHFGASDLTVFLENEIRLDSSHQGRQVALQIKIGGEACVFIDDVPHNGLDANRDMIPLSESARGDEVYHIRIEAYSKDLIVDSSTKFVTDLHMTRCRLVAVNPVVYSYYQDVWNLYDFSRLFHDEYVRQRTQKAVYDSLLLLDYERARFTDSVRAAKTQLAADMARYKDLRIPVDMQFTGHSHIDVAWHWPLKETVRKVSRTFSSMLQLMKRYDKFTFSQSMPVLYEMARQHYPSLFEQIKERIAQGRWETVGSMYVEPDCNLISGESFVRQVLYGKRYYKEVLGSDSDICFLPDVFGYSPAMPQIMKKAGTNYFFTTKLTWNETNEFPYSVFRWRGLDGTEILSGMMSMCTVNGLGLYSGDMSPEGLDLALDYYKNKSEDTPILYLYGHGDGGGGVTPEMLDTLDRLEAIPLMPRIKTGTVADYFAAIDDDAKEYPVWNGDLYFEKHRGTYTTAANNKKNNRRSEFLFRDAEILASLAQIQAGERPNPNLEEGWKLILLNQFHDILPGTSVAHVYEDSDRDYEKIFAIGGESIRRSAAALTGGEADAVTVCNTLSWSRSAVVRVDTGGRAVVDPDGRPVRQVPCEQGVAFLAEDVPPMGCRVYRLTGQTAAASADKAAAPADGLLHISNPFFEITINQSGEITSLFDKAAGRQVLQAGKHGNLLQLQEDIPVEWYAAWETTRKREDKPAVRLTDTKLTLLEDNDLYTTVGLTGTIHNSKVEQRIRLDKHQPRIAFETTVDWNERNRILRVGFPVAVNSSDAYYDVAFGNIARPNHLTTSFDEAKFEVCGHKWGDVSERNYGVSLLNDCKYGYSITHSVMELSLLRSADFPSPTCDQGVHTFTYWLYPHAGDIAQAKVAQAGYETNVPLLVLPGAAKASGSSITAFNDSMIVDTFKPAEDGEGYILRVYETYNTTAPASLRFGFDVDSCWECNLLEENIGIVEVVDNGVTFPLTPFEIKTFRVKPR